MCCEDVKLFHLAEDRVQWWTFVVSDTNLSASVSTGQFVNSRILLGYSLDNRKSISLFSRGEYS
jgi:hypothetical protein